MDRATPTTHGKEASHLENRGLCLLSLDGGGVRGLFTLYILKGLMDRLIQERTNVPPLKLCEVFDLIGGTITGGYVFCVNTDIANMGRLIAIMLGRLEMDVEECIAAYTRLMETVFESKSSRLPAS
jgi:hypothetical protein